MAKNPVLDFMSTPPASRFTVITIAKHINHIRFVNIAYPGRVQRLINGNGTFANLNAFGYIIPTLITDTITPSNSNVPYVFRRSHLSVDFLTNNLYNIFAYIFTLLVIGILTLANMLLSNFKPNGSKSINLIKSFLVIVKWNFFIMQLAYNFNDTLLYSGLQAWNINLNQDASVLILISCILNNALNVLVIALAVLIPYSYHKSNTQVQSVDGAKNKNFLTRFRKKHQNSFQIFINPYNKGTFARYFYLTYILRVAAPTFITMILWNVNPLAQTSIFLVINIIFTVFLALNRKIVPFINYIHLVSLEILMFAIHLCVLVLSTKQGDSYFKLQNTLGDVIVVCNFLINFSFYIFLLVWIVMNILRIVETKRQRKPVDPIAEVFNFSFHFFQQSTFGFEWISFNDINNPNIGSRFSIFKSKNAKVTPDNLGDGHLKNYVLDPANSIVRGQPADFNTSSSPTSSIRLINKKTSRIKINVDNSSVADQLKK